jgi:hypothetical protein
MPPLKINRWPKPICGWLGTVEPKTRTWILFVGVSEKAALFCRRDPVTGAVLFPG